MMKVHFAIIFNCFLFGAISNCFVQEDIPLKYVQQSTIKGVFNEKQTIVEIHKGVHKNDTIYLYKSLEQIPLYYAKKINTEVCYSKECRPLKITVYWNITGRYLGYELPDKEFLSKYDHEPFSEGEYKKLNELLANPDLPFNNISFEKLTKSSNTNNELDAISGATAKNVSNIVVKGAAYTTYKLWNIINGPSIEMVSVLTERQLTPDLIDLILKSPISSDKIWALDRINENIELTQELNDSMLSIISGDDVYMAYNTLEAINSDHLESSNLQERVFSIYKNASPTIKKSIIEKLMEAPFLSQKVVMDSRHMLENLNGKQLEFFLKLYAKFLVTDIKTCSVVARMLDNRNRYISKKAYNFLVNNNITYPSILKSIKKYERNNPH